MEENTNQELSTPLLVQDDGNDDEGGGGGDPEAGTEATAGEDTANDYESIATLKSSNKTPTVDYTSHFTLRIPTSTVHFRGNILRVIDTDQDQIILQERMGGGAGSDDDDKDKVIVKRLSPATLAQRSLRIGYTLITILFLGFLFVFCFQVLLFLFIALPVDAGFTSGNTKVKTVAIISTLLSFPVMMYGMASLMGK